MEERELFKEIINKSLETNDMFLFNMFVASLISADNNQTDEEVKKNCKSIETLIDILGDYPDNEKFQKNRQQLIDYNKMYLK